MRLDDELDSRNTLAGLLMVLGLVLFMGGAYVLFNPGSDYNDVVSVQKLYLGQTGALVGAILFGSGSLLKFLR